MIPTISCGGRSFGNETSPNRPPLSNPEFVTGEMEMSVNIQCHCQLTAVSLSIPSTSFPLKSALCHCDSCRHATGLLFATWAVIPAPLPAEVLESGDLVKYESSSTCQRWFCRRCGASVLNIDRGDGADEWEVGTGVLHLEGGNRMDGKLKRVQLWVDDVKGDGGAAIWINKGRLELMDRHWKGRKSDLVGDEIMIRLMGERDGEAEKHFSEISLNNKQLQGQCHCQNITFSISRPEKDFNRGSGKFQTSLDACTSCRTVTGFEITSWATIPKRLIKVDSGLDAFLADRSRLGHYKTSAEVSRYFCIGCGATIFYQHRDQNSEAIDVALGLLEPTIKGCVRLEDWLDWERYPQGLAFPEDAVDREFVRNIQEGMRMSEEARELKGD